MNEAYQNLKYIESAKGTRSQDYIDAFSNFQKAARRSGLRLSEALDKMMIKHRVKIPGGRYFYSIGGKFFSPTIQHTNNGTLHIFKTRRDLFLVKVPSVKQAGQYNVNQNGITNGSIFIFTNPANSLKKSTVNLRSIKIQPKKKYKFKLVRRKRSKAIDNASLLLGNLKL